MILIKNKGTKAYPWGISDNCYIRGRFEYGGKIYTATAIGDLISVITALQSEQEFVGFIRELRGYFSIIVDRPESDETWCAVDIASSFPLFFHEGKHLASDDAELIRQTAGIAADDLSMENYGELLLTNYNLFNHTVYRDILQVDAGQCVFLKGTHSRGVFYYTHTCEIVQETYEQAYTRFKVANQRMADRMFQMLDGRQAVIALSGGYDSRYIVALLKERNYQNVVCFTTGKADTFEMQFAMQICKKTGYLWYGIENTDAISVQQASGEMDDYLLSAHHHSTLSYYAFYHAIKYLRDNRLIAQNAVLITGFCGDLPAGSFVFHESDRTSLQYNRRFLAEMFYYDEYFNYECAKSVDNQYITKIKEYIDMKYDFEPDNFQNFVRMHDALFTCSRPAKFVINANRCFEYLGYEWLLPQWDQDFLDYWYSVSCEYRQGQKLYRDFLNRELFDRWDISMLKRFEHTQPWYFRRKRLKTQFKHWAGSLLYRVCYACNIPVRRRVDFDNQALVTLAFYRRTHAKWFFNFHRPVVNPFLQVWLCEKLYGDASLRRVKAFMNGLEDHTVHD